MQQDARPAEREHLEPEEAEDERDRSEGRREDQTGVEELDGDREHAEREQQRDDVRVDERVEDAIPERHLDRRRSRRPPCAGRSPSARVIEPVDLVRAAWAGRARSRSITFCSSASRAVRFDASRTASLRPVGVAPVLLRRALRASGGVVDDLAASDPSGCRRRRPRSGSRSRCSSAGPLRGCPPPARSRRRPRRPGRRPARRRRSPGCVEASSFLTMSRIDSASPPGVSSRIDDRVVAVLGCARSISPMR